MGLCSTTHLPQGAHECGLVNSVHHGNREHGLLQTWAQGFFKARGIGLQHVRPAQASALHNVGLLSEVPYKPQNNFLATSGDCFCACHVVTSRHRLEQHAKCLCLPTAMHATPWPCITLCTPTSMQEIARIEIDIFSTIQKHIKLVPCQSLSC